MLQNFGVGYTDKMLLGQYFEMLPSLAGKNICFLMAPKTKLVCTFTSQFSVSGFFMLYRLDRNSRSSGILVHIRDPLIVFKLKKKVPTTSLKP